MRTSVITERTRRLDRRAARGRGRLVLVLAIRLARRARLGDVLVIAHLARELAVPPHRVVRVVGVVLVAVEDLMRVEGPRERTNVGAESRGASEAELKGVARGVSASKAARGPALAERRMRRERKSLRNEVHNANAVVRGPVRRIIKRAWRFPSLPKTRARDGEKSSALCLSIASCCSFASLYSIADSSSVGAAGRGSEVMSARVPVPVRFRSKKNFVDNEQERKRLHRERSFFGRTYARGERVREARRALSEQRVELRAQHAYLLLVQVRLVHVRFREQMTLALRSSDDVDEGDENVDRAKYRRARVTCQ
jgi:hypothetical protein